MSDENEKSIEEKAIEMLEAAGPDDELVDAAAEDTAREMEQEDDQEETQPEPTAPDEPDPWNDLREKYSPDDILRSLEERDNLKEQQAEAHRRNEEARRSKDRTDRILDTLTEMGGRDPEAAVRMLRSFSGQPQEPEQIDYSDPDTVQRRLAQMEEQIQAVQRRWAQDKIEAATAEQIGGASVLQDLPEPIRDTIREQVSLRLSNDPTLHPSTLRDRAREMIAEEAKLYTGLRDHFVNSYRASLSKKAEKPSVPRGSGPRSAALSRPAERKKPNVSTQGGWDEMEKAVAEELDRLLSEE